VSTIDVWFGPVPAATLPTATSDIVGWGALAVSLAFVGVAVAVAAEQRLALGGPIITAVSRSLVQMTLVGLALVPIVDPTTPMYWSWMWVAAIVVMAALTTARRVPAVPGAFWVALITVTIVAAVGLGLLFGLQIFELNGRTLVPVTGMLVGNAMKTTIVAATRVTEIVADQRDEIEAAMALGLSVRAASRRLVRSAVRTAISPQVEQTAALGIVVLPGTMTGLILAGVEPLEAVRVQLALMYVILAGVVTAGTLMALGTVDRLTTGDQRLRTVRRGR